MLRVTLYSYDPSADPAWEAAEPVEVDFVSHFNGATHGPPALIAPGRENGHPVPTRAKIGDEVLYVNTAIVPAYRAERISD